jgi:extracellular factor (EF) 3-hydroxypalmitic acid methyl ester biosynthesis protein
MDARFSDDLVQVVDDMEACLRGWTEAGDRLQFFHAIKGLLRETEARMACLAPAARREYIDWWRARLHPHFLQAASLRRCFEKPRGYAGDYEMMNMAYRNQPEGETPLGRVLHHGFISSLGVNAVRTRRRWILQQMQKHALERGLPSPYRLMSVACGSAIECQDLVRESFLADHAEITCIDQDEEALAYAERGLKATIEACERLCTARFVNDSVRSLIKGQDGPPAYPPQDFIYSLGLYDYLPERAAAALTRALFQMLKPGGKLVAGNYLPCCDVRFELELILEWPLIYRTAEALRALADGLPESARIALDVEPGGQLGFLIVEKAAV